MSGNVGVGSPLGAEEEKRRRRVINVVYAIVTMDTALMFLQFSVTPYLAKKLGFDTLWLGYLQTTVGVIQLFGGPMFGRFADLFGARAALSLSFAATVVFFLLLAAANHPIMLFIHKVPTVFMHVMPVAQMVITDLSLPEKQADGLAKIGLCFGVGMITGSMLGGHMNTHYGESFTACFCAVASFLTLLLVLKFIPKTTKDQTAKTSKEISTKKQSLFNVGEIVRLMKFPNVALTFIVKIVAGLPSGIFQVMFSVLALEFFKLQPQENGYLMAYFGIMQMIIQGAVLGRLTMKYSEWSLLVMSIAVSAVVGLAQVYIQTVFQFCVNAVPMMFSLSVFNVITNSMLTKSVPASDTGTMLGLCASVQNMFRTVGPTAGGFLYVNYGVASIGFIQFVVNAAVLFYLMLRGAPKTQTN